MIKIPFICENCGKPGEKSKWDFESAKRHFCNNECHDNFRRKSKDGKITKTCPNCQTEFYLYKSSGEKINSGVIFCCRKCRKEYNRKDVDIKDIINMYEVEQLGIETICEKHNIGRWIVESILRENNVVIRDKHWVLTNRPPFMGHKHSDECKAEMSRLRKNYYKNNPSMRDEARLRTIELCKNGKMGTKDTSIEIAIMNLLLKLQITFESQKIFGYWVFDFYLPHFDLFIECDGDYWHAHPDEYDPSNINATQRKNIERDIKKTQYVLDRGHNFIRFWERDIKKHLDIVETSLKLKLQDITNNLIK